MRLSALNMMENSRRLICRWLCSNAIGGVRVQRKSSGDFKNLTA